MAPRGGGRPRGRAVHLARAWAVLGALVEGHQRCWPRWEKAQGPRCRAQSGASCSPCLAGVITEGRTLQTQASLALSGDMLSPTALSHKPPLSLRLPEHPAVQEPPERTVLLVTEGHLNPGCGSPLGFTAPEPVQPSACLLPSCLSLSPPSLPCLQAASPTGPSHPFLTAPQRSHSIRSVPGLQLTLCGLWGSGSPGPPPAPLHAALAHILQAPPTPQAHTESPLRSAGAEATAPQELLSPPWAF